MATEREEGQETTPTGWAAYWQEELSAAKKEVEKWHTQGEKIIKRFRDERDSKAKGDTRWNLFSANILTQRPMLYGQTPKVSVDRRFADANDDLARVGAEMLERLLNTDIEKDSDSYARALKYVLDDRLLPGLGIARVRYVAEFEDVPEEPAQLDAMGAEVSPAIPAYSKKTYECVETDYVHWTDYRWTAGARVQHEVTWVGFREKMSRPALVKRFGEALGKAVPLNGKSPKEGEGDNPRGRADVWEIWSKDEKRVFWYVEGFHTVLDEKPDPLGLDSFFPCPEPFLANVTTSTLVPRPDFVIAQDLYDQIDELSTRIALLVDAVRVAGVYDKSAGSLQKLLGRDAPRENGLVPVDNWAAFTEKGGIRGSIDWLPLEQITGAISVLSEHRRELVDALYQITGMSDIMRGQASTAATTATEQSIKAKFGSVRIQSLQDEFARFASDLQRLKAEIISKHFDVETILTCSNVGMTEDAQLAPQAAELIKSKFGAYRIQVKPESVSLADFAALKADKMETLMGFSTFMQAAAPVAQQLPGSMPFLLKFLQWAMSGIRGSSGIESVLDAAIAQAEQAAQQPQQAAQQAPDPKVITQQMKGQQDLAKVQAELQADLMRTQADVQADAQREQNQAIWNVREAAQKHAIAQAGRALQPPKAGGPGGLP